MAEPSNLRQAATQIEWQKLFLTIATVQTATHTHTHTPLPLPLAEAVSLEAGRRSAQLHTLPSSSSDSNFICLFQPVNLYARRGVKTF